ncbi:MAG: CopD family protein [Lacibacter sp.]
MTYLYVKALHIIFIVTWFAGLFYMPRLLIYNTEANLKPNDERRVLQEQFGIMMRRLWFGITWPSAILTLIFGLWVLLESNLYRVLTDTGGRWLLLKLIFVFFLYLYHFSLQRLLRQQIRGVFRYTSMQLRLWNEVATIFLVAVVLLVVVRQNMSVVWGVLGLFFLVLLFMLAIRIYKVLRMRKS